MYSNSTPTQNFFFLIFLYPSASETARLNYVRSASESGTEREHKGVFGKDILPHTISSYTRWLSIARKAKEIEKKM